jgi:membrane-associated phospholipid phosphatase
VLTWLLHGTHDDVALFRHVSGTDLVRVRAAGGRALETIDVGSVVLVTVVIALVARRRALAAVGVVVLSVGSVELLKTIRDDTFPSGHVAVAASLGLALALAVPPAVRPLVQLVGAAYAAGVALAVVVLAWHYPTDAVGAFCVAGFWTSLLGGGRRPTFTRAGVVLAVAAVGLGLVVAAWIAYRHPVGVAALRTRHALVATALLFGAVSLATFAVAP